MGGGARLDRRGGVEPGWAQGQAPPTARSHRPLPLLPHPQLRRMQEMLQKMKQQMQDQ